jgi:hypothetical protein
MEIVKKDKKPKKQQPEITMKIEGLQILIMTLLLIKNFFKKRQRQEKHK